MDKDKFVSLADVLGVDPVQATGVKPKPEDPPREVRAARKLTVKKFCKEILESQEYREHLYRLIVRDAIPPAIEQLLYFYAEGKPVEKLEVSEKPANLEDLTVEQLEARISHLHEMVKGMRRSEDPEEEGEAPNTRVH